MLLLMYLQVEKTVTPYHLITDMRFAIFGLFCGKFKAVVQNVRKVVENTLLLL